MRTRIVAATFISALSSVLCASTTQTASDDLLRFDIRRAQDEATRQCEKLECKGPIEILVTKVRPADAPIADTVRRTDGKAGCVIRISRRALTRMEVIDHEACHCALDYDVLDTFGYLLGVSDAEVSRREDLAHDCEDKLGAGR